MVLKTCARSAGIVGSIQQTHLTSRFVSLQPSVYFVPHNLDPATYLLPTIACCCWWETEGPSSPPSRPWSTTGVPWPVSVSYDHESAPSLVHTCPSRSPGGTTNPIITRCHICNRPASSTPPPLHRLRDHDMYAEPDVHTKRQQQSICAKVLLLSKSGELSNTCIYSHPFLAR